MIKGMSPTAKHIAEYVGSDDPNNYFHIHPSLLDDQKEGVKLLNRLVRRGVLLRPYEDLYVRNNEANRATYNTAK